MSPGSVYDRPVWRLIMEGVEQLPETFTTTDMVNWFAENYPNVSPGSVTGDLRGACVNLPVDRFMRSGRPERLVLYKVGRSEYTRYRPEVHGVFDDRGQPIGALDAAEDDYLRDVGADALDGAISTAAAEFALEIHLEEFMEANWTHLDFGVPLEIYSEGGAQVGRQYRTPIGVIDFLCRDSNSGSFWVIELKRGHSSDSVVGQVLRYMGWVQENVSDGKAVHGLVITHEHDDRLRYAVKMVPNVQAWTYRINFEFNRQGVAV